MKAIPSLPAVAVDPRCRRVFGHEVLLATSRTGDAGS